MRAVREHLGYVAVIAMMAIAGVVAAGYLLVKQRFPVPLQDTYDVRVVLEAADGVAPGLGQAVTVSGVRVGSIQEARLVDRRAEVTLSIQRRHLRAVHRDASADLRPVTPLKDMELVLHPGSAKAPVLPPGGTIPLQRTSVPVPLADLLSTLDADTRGFFTTLVGGLDDGTAERGTDMRKLLLALGPTVSDVRRVVTAVDGRRKELAGLVTRLSRVTRAASADGRLGDLIATSERTLQTLAEQDVPLRRALASLPGALDAASGALTTVGSLSRDLRPALVALNPRIRRLPTMFGQLRTFTDAFTSSLRTELRPLSREARPLAVDLGPATTGVARISPDLSRSLQVASYAANELGYNPPGKDEGMLFWLAWFAQNWNSMISTQDAHGAFLRASLNVNCQQITTLLDLAPLFRALTGTTAACPAT